MKNNRNKIMAAVCWVIVGSVGTSIVGNFQANEDVNSTVDNNNENIQIPDSSEFEQYFNGSNGTTDRYAQGYEERSVRGGVGGKGNHH